MLTFLLGPVGRILLLCAIVAIILGAVAAKGYKAGVLDGKAEIQEQWDADKEAARKSYDDLVRQLAKQEGIHAAEQQRISNELVRVRENLASSLAAQRSVYEQRLLQSSRRSEVYRDQAEASIASCRSLASHAAELDRTLEEGRHLVGELRQTVGLRDNQLTLLGEQILLDRKLMEGEKTK